MTMKAVDPAPPVAEEVVLSVSSLDEKLRKYIREVDGHWVWTGATITVNDGAQTYSSHGAGPSRYVHRQTFAALNGDLDSARRLHQTCDVELCVLPTHWTLMRRGPRVIKREQEYLFLEEVAAYVTMRLGELRRRRLVDQ